MASAAAPASYGPLPTNAPPSTFLTRANNTHFLAPRRPWRELIEMRPFSLGNTTIRIKYNLSYFRVNYTMIILFILFLSLLWHPLSMTVFLIVFVAWFFLYFFRGQPLVIIHRTIDDRLVLGLLSVVTIAALILTHVWLNVLISLLIGAAIVVLHAASRRTDDLYLDEQDLPSRMARDIESPVAVPARAMSPSEMLAGSRRTDDLYLDEQDLPSRMARDIEPPVAVPARAMSPSEMLFSGSGSGSGSDGRSVSDSGSGE